MYYTLGLQKLMSNLKKILDLTPYSAFVTLNVSHFIYVNTTVSNSIFSQLYVYICVYVIYILYTYMCLWGVCCWFSI